MTLNMQNIFPVTDSEDEFFRATKDKGVAWYYVGGDYVPAVLANSTSVVVLANYTIPAGTVVNGIKITARVEADGIVATPSVGSFRIRTGTLGAETTKTFIVLADDADDQSAYDTFSYVETSLNWSATQSVLIVASNSVASPTSSISCWQLMIEGF